MTELYNLLCITAALIGSELQCLTIHQLTQYLGDVIHMPCTSDKQKPLTPRQDTDTSR